MNRNVEVALKLGWTNTVGCNQGCGDWINPDGVQEDLPDYINDNAVALTLVPKIGQLVTMQYEAGELPDFGGDSWSVECISNQIWECKATLSTAIVDAFLVMKEGE